jgi:hypothetical protein
MQRGMKAAFAAAATAALALAPLSTASAGTVLASDGGGGGTTYNKCIGQLLGNPGFEAGTPAPWSASTGVVDNLNGEPTHSGSWKAWLDGYGTSHTDTLSQTVTLPTGCASYTLAFWLHVDTAETSATTKFDTLVVRANSTTLATYSNLDHNSGYTQKSFSLAGMAGQPVTISFVGTEDTALQTSFVIDDTATAVTQF